MSQKSKLTVYKSVYEMMYSCESWTLNDRHEKTIQAMEMRLMRRIEKKTRTGRVSNVNIRENLKLFSLKLKARNCVGLATSVGLSLIHI